MENHVTSRELSEKLKVAGYPQESTFRWTKERISGEWKALQDYGINYVGYAAPLSDELLEQLPDNFKVELFKRVLDDDGYWSWGIEAGELGGNIGYVEDAGKPTDVLAELWLWCKEQGYIK